MPQLKKDYLACDSTEIEGAIMHTMDLHRLNPPDRPGVYIMRDSHEKIIYVGKAISLRKRLASYFRSSDKLDPKTQALVEKINAIEFMVTDSEVEALILESTLIKKHRPRYNIVMRDDKSYPYIKLTTQDSFPRLITTRKPFMDQARYFGPFISAGPLKDAVRAVSRHFRLCQIKQIIRVGQNRKRVCLYYQMGQCDGACLGKITSQDYAGHVRAAIAFLEGGEDPISPQLKALMEQAAQQEQYELAASYRDQLDIMSKIRHQPIVSSPLREDRDIFGLARSGAAAAVEIFFVRAGNLEGRRHFILQGTGASSDSEVLSQIIIQYYSQPVNIPPQIVLPSIPEDEPIVLKWLTTLRRDDLQLIIPEENEMIRLLKMAETNAWLYLKQHVSENVTELTEENKKRLEDLAARLGLNGLPVRVEGYDISNISGQDAVGSRVVFTNGQPDKSNYRRYKIRSVVGPNDFAMLQEVLARRLRRLKEGKEEPPDLIVVDGGAGQLSAAQMVLRELDILHIPVIGLAKREEEIYRVGYSDPLVLPKTSQALQFLTRLRDEAHRFAVSYHRVVRGRRMKVSDLDQVPGLGPERRRQLLRTFGSVESLLQVSEEELAKTAGVGMTLAKKIQSVLKKISR